MNKNPETKTLLNHVEKQEAIEAETTKDLQKEEASTWLGNGNVIKIWGTHGFDVLE